MLWQISSFPRCSHHAFLSHCAEDRDWLVHPVYDELQRRQIIPWLDRDHYSYGRDSRLALREGLLRSRHAVFFVTLAMLDHRRGWCPVELAYSDILGSNLSFPGGSLTNYYLPLYFVDPGSPDLRRSVWNAPHDRATYYPGPRNDAVQWAADQIVKFLKEEQIVAMNVHQAIVPGADLDTYLRGKPGLLQRTTMLDPGPIQ